MADPTKAFSRRFGREPVFRARAPGRVEFIGNHTDYNGGEVLGAAVDRFLSVRVAPREDGVLRFASEGNPRTVSFPDQATAFDAAEGWVRYPLGVLSLLREKGAAPDHGFDFLVGSEIPSGAGLSSSAAFELASSLVFEAMAGVSLEPLERVRLCRRAENEVVGVPCGILDQAVSGFGEAGRLVHIDCAEEKITTVDGPAESRLWIFESGQKHSLVDSLYSERHRECGEALAVLRERDPGLCWLAHADPGSLEYVRERAGDTVYRRARHIVEENRRVRDCVAKLAAADLAGVGRLLLESHRSSSTLFENSIAELDTLVELLDGREAVRGARLTGGGFGGAVMALCGDGFTEESAAAVAAGFAERHGAEPTFRRLEIADGAGEERS